MVGGGLGARGGVIRELDVSRWEGGQGEGGEWREGRRGRGGVVVGRVRGRGQGMGAWRGG